MQNIPDNPGMPPEQFIHVYAKIMAGWGMPATAGRVLAFLTLQSRPVSLDEIAESLGISKAGAWNAARHLEQVGQLERFGEKGSKRVLFAPMSDIGHSLADYSRLLLKLSRLMREGQGGMTDPEAARQLGRRSEFYLAAHKALEGVMAEFAERTEPENVTGWAAIR